MAKYLQTNQFTGSIPAVDVVNTGVLIVRHPAPIVDGVDDAVTVMGSLSLASGVNFAVNDVVELAILPADHVPIEFSLVSDSFDSNVTPTLAGSIGLMTGQVGDTSRDNTKVGVEGGTALLFGKTAVSDYLRCLSPLFARIAPSSTADRSIGMKITAIAATSPAAVRQLDFIFTYRAARYGL